jgi:ubiquinone/menaquinone biosynthesis C-methylase UbiE
VHTAIPKNYDLKYLEYLSELLAGLKERSYTFLTPRNSDTVTVDLGCGTGDDCRTLALQEPAGQIIGVDHDPETIRYAIGNTDINKYPNLRFLVSEANRIDLPSGSVDHVRCERIIQHLPDSDGAFAEIKRILNPGGRLVILETDWASLSFGTTMIKEERQLIDEKLNHQSINGLASRNIKDHLLRHGFKPEKIESHTTYVNRYQEMEYISGLPRTLQSMADKGIDMSKLIEHLKEQDENGVFSFSWVTVLYVAGVRK